MSEATSILSARSPNARITEPRAGELGKRDSVAINTRMQALGELFAMRRTVIDSRGVATSVRTNGSTRPGEGHGDAGAEWMQQQLLRVVDTIGRPLVVFGARGMMLHRSRSLAQILVTEPGRDALMRTARELAWGIMERLDTRGLSGDWRAAPATTLCPHRRTYTLQPYMVPAGVFSSTSCAVVVIERAPTRSRSDTAGDLSGFGFTKRQEQVARLLLAYYSAPEIAQALTISSHTARHHVEQVYRKAHVSGRHELRAKIAARGALDDKRVTS